MSSGYRSGNDRDCCTQSMDCSDQQMLSVPINLDLSRQICIAVGTPRYFFD